MKWPKRGNRAQGGAIPSDERLKWATGHSSDRMAVLNRGVAVVPDAALARHGREYFERLNGGGKVYSASEMHALQSES